MVSAIGLLYGISASGVVLSSVLFGLFSFYHAKKKEARLLAVAGVMMVIIGLFWLGQFVEFLLLLTTGKNLNPIELYAWLSYCWVAPGIIIAMYLGSELMWPEKKRIILVIYGTLGIIFEFFLFFDVNSVCKFTLNNPGEEPIDLSFVRTHPAYWIIAFFLASALIFLCIGFAIKARQATGELRKKFTFLSLGFFVFVICAASESLIPPSVVIGFTRALMMTFAMWMYLGLREKRVKTTKLPSEQKILTEKSEVSLIETLLEFRPLKITNEEVSMYREQQICLVCKGEIYGYNNFICRCKAIYCAKCAKALEDLENACWVCQKPIDESKPVKLLEREEEIIDMEMMEKALKKPKEGKK